MSTGRSFELDAWICATRDEDEQQIGINLRYETDKPWSVLLLARSTQYGIQRYISRELLLEGMDEEAGSVDSVTVRPDNTTMVEIRIRATACNGPHVYIRVFRTDLDRVLSAIDAMVEPGQEAAAMDWDAGIAHCEAA